MKQCSKWDAALLAAALFLLISGIFCGGRMKTSGTAAPNFLALSRVGLLAFVSLPFLLCGAGTLLRFGALLQSGVVFCMGCWLGGCSSFGAFLPTLLCALCVTALFPHCAKQSMQRSPRTLARRARFMIGRLHMLLFAWGGCSFCWLVAKLAAG